IYAVAGVREENGQEAFGMSDTVNVNSDATVPGTPDNLALELVANGIKVTWDAPPFTEDITYNLYRSDQAQITSVEGMTPLIHSIPNGPAPIVIDPAPSSTEHCYAVTAVDGSGNQSAPSVSAYENFGLLPVAGIAVTQTDAYAPQVTWTDTQGNIAGYDLYLGTRETGVKVNSDHMTAKTYTDSGYSGDERTYSVVVVDTYEVESPARSIFLPKMQAALADGQMLYRGVMNRLDFTVQNLSTVRVEDISLKVDVASHLHTSEPFAMDAGQSVTISVPVGGYATLLDMEDITTT
ncbi:MAG: hypothetical protein GY867_06690, partial [bacterium]|nr:hypothetical protein [bacterium]